MSELVEHFQQARRAERNNDVAQGRWSLFRIPRVSHRLIARCVGAALAALVNLLVLMILLVSTEPLRLAPAPVLRARELVLTLPPLAKRVSQPKPQPSTEHPKTERAFDVRPSLLFPPATEPSARAQNLGADLFGCSMENFESLSEEARSHCRYIMATIRPRLGPSLYGRAGSLVKDNAKWAADLARKKAPMQIPCTSVMTTGRNGSGAIPMINPLCAIFVAIKGLKKEDFGGYSSDPEYHKN